jgi:microcompartment protein CcmL/EutN
MSQEAIGMIETKGYVGSVEAKAAGKVGELVGSHILARPHEDLMKVIIGEPAKK